MFHGNVLLTGANMEAQKVSFVSSLNKYRVSCSNSQTYKTGHHLVRHLQCSRSLNDSIENQSSMTTMPPQQAEL